MTKILLKKSNGHIVSLAADGHTGYGVEGEDIVCSALSSVIQTALLGLLKVAAIDVKYSILEETGSLEFCLPKELDQRDRNNADMILETMLVGIVDLYENYSDFIDLEVQE